MTVELSENEKSILKAQAALLQLEKRKAAVIGQAHEDRLVKENEIALIDQNLNQALDVIEDEIQTQNDLIESLSQEV